MDNNKIVIEIYFWGIITALFVLIGMILIIMKG